MGAFDSYDAEARCPRCGDIHAVDGQTKFFMPDFAGLSGRWFRPWVPQELDFEPQELHAARVWDGSWWRVREPGDAARLDLLADFDECFGCDCGLMFAVVLRFRVDDGRPPSATLVAVELRDADSEAAVAVDFADGEAMVWAGDHANFDAAMRALAEAPLAARSERLREALRRRFTPDPAPTEPAGWMSELEDVRCAACGATKTRTAVTMLAHPDFPTSFFGPGWTGGRLARGMRFEGDWSWLADDHDRGYFTRLRHPVPEDRLVVLGQRLRTGCACGCGRGALVLTFTREPGALVLTDIAVRVVRGAEDLRDVDFADAAWWTRDSSGRAGPRHGAWTREGAFAAVLAALTRA